MTAQRQVFDDVVLDGDGFTLRRPEPRDAERIVQACTDEDTLRWLPLPRPYGPAEATAFVEVTARDALRQGTGLVSAIDVDGQLAGMIDLNSTDWRARTTAIGYWTCPDSRGRGLAGRATRLLSGWALRHQQIERVEVRAATGNIPSQRVAEAAGFRYEGVLRSAGITHHGRVDLVVYGLTRADLSE